jgi:hypothetical protein
MLKSRAGEPAWGPELLAREQLINGLDGLPGFFNDWERWAADITETHVNYPWLMSFRSPYPLRSWVVSLVAVMDAAALYLALAPSRAPSAARHCLRTSFLGLRALARVRSAAGGDVASWAWLAARTERAIVRRCYDPARGVFTSLYGARDARPGALTVASLAPVLLRDLPGPLLDRLTALVADRARFDRRYPLPSVAADEPTYRPGASPFLWRGPTWLSTNWLVYEGLRRHGRREAARHLAERSLALVRHAGFREYYNAETGAGHGAREFGWSTLVVEMLRTLP